MSKQFWAVLVIIALVFVGIFAFGGKKSATTTSANAKPSSHIIGEGKTGITLVEYGDYQCPYCQEYASVVKQVQQEYNQQIFFQFRNFPLVNIHANAFAAARAAEAAGLQNKFWEMHDALYNLANWSVWTVASDPTKYFTLYAQQIGLDIPKYQSDYASSQVNNTINADMAAGNKLNITGTPTYFLDGKQISVAIDVKAFEKVINAEIAAKTAATKQ